MEQKRITLIPQLLKPGLLLEIRRSLRIQHQQLLNEEEIELFPVKLSSALSLQVNLKPNCAKVVFKDFTHSLGQSNFRVFTPKFQGVFLIVFNLSGCHNRKVLSD